MDYRDGYTFLAFCWSYVAWGWSLLAKHHYFTEKNIMGVRESEILIDSTIPFKALEKWGNEEPRQEGQNIWAVDAKKAVFRGGGGEGLGYSPVHE